MVTGKQEAAAALGGYLYETSLTENGYQAAIVWVG